MREVIGVGDCSSDSPRSLQQTVAVTPDTPIRRSRLHIDFHGREVRTGRAHAAGVLETNNGALRIGTRSQPKAFFAGSIDEVAIYDRALSAAEIAAIFTAGASGKCKRLVAVDIKPDSERNCIAEHAKGAIPVVVFGSRRLDAADIDPSSIRLQGRPVKTVGNVHRSLAHFEDVNSDGVADLVVQIQDGDEFPSWSDGAAILTGRLRNGETFYGVDFICVVP